jgi:membrane fusion protein, multidrug efflux system
MSTAEKAELTPPRSASKRRTWTWLAVLAIAAVIIAGVVRGIRKSEADKTAAIEPLAIPTVKTATAHLGSIGYYVEALGTVTPVATVNLYSQINGQVVAVHYVEGQMVHRGDPFPALRSPVEASPGNLAARSRSADASRNGSSPL